MYTVLHWDSNGLHKEILQGAFTKQGIRYLEVKNPVQAQEILQDEPVDMMLMTLSSDTPAEDFIRQLNDTPDYKSMPVLIINSDTSLEERKKLFDWGVLDYFTPDTPLERIVSYASKIIKQNNDIMGLENLNIAVLSDSELDSQIIRKMLSSLRAGVIDYYYNPNDLSRSDRNYDIYLIDFVLKDTSGDNVISYIRTVNPHAVIVAISSITNFKVISNILISGADDYILKPFNRDLFYARLKANLRSFLFIRELEKKNRLLEKMAITDSQTGLFNHNAIFEMLFHEIERHQRYDNKLSLILFDIDYFKSINDTYGHLEGDRMLQYVAHTIKSCLRKTDILGRYGGDEFLIILTETNLKHAVIVADKIIKKIHETEWDEPTMHVTVSGGVAEYRGESLIAFVKTVDDLLYKAKSNGKNRIES